MSQCSHAASDKRSRCEPVRSRACAALLLGIGFVLAGRARADEPLMLREEAPSRGPEHAQPRGEEARSAGQRARDYWSEAPARPFVAGVLDAGSSIRGRALLGWGKPHWTWGGLELEGASTSDTALTAVRARLALVIADVGVAYRKTWAYRRTFVPHDDHLTNEELKGSPKAHYRSLDIDVWGVIPAGRGFVQWEVETVRLYGVPKGADLYEEWLRAPVRAPVATDARLAYAHSFYDDRATVGLMAEWLWLGGRGMSYRVGPLLGFTFTPHWELNVLLTTPVSSPDELGFFPGLYGTIRMRWRFATGERRSIFR
jgi:hypothetical protein